MNAPTSTGTSSAASADVADPAQVQAVADRGLQVYGRLDTWVHMAGILLVAVEREVCGRVLDAFGRDECGWGVRRSENHRPMLTGSPPAARRATFCNPTGLRIASLSVQRRVHEEGPKPRLWPFVASVGLDRVTRR